MYIIDVHASSRCKLSVLHGGLLLARGYQFWLQNWFGGPLFLSKSVLADQFLGSKFGVTILQFKIKLSYSYHIAMHAVP